MKVEIQKSGKEFFAWVGTEKEYVSAQSEKTKEKALEALVLRLYESHKKLETIKKAIK